MKHIKLFEKVEDWDDPFGEDIQVPIDIVNIYDYYFNPRTHYNVFDGQDYVIKPMERSDGYGFNFGRFYPEETVLYLGLRHAGGFFAYRKKYVWVFISNSNIKKNTMRHDRGLYLTITTVDDSALYADWLEPITEEQLQRVIEYFDFYEAMDEDKKVLKDIEDIIGRPCTYFDFS